MTEEQLAFTVSRGSHLDSWDYTEDSASANQMDSKFFQSGL